MQLRVLAGQLDGLPALEHQGARRVGDDHLGCTPAGTDDQVGGLAPDQPVRGRARAVAPPYVAAWRASSMSRRGGTCCGTPAASRARAFAGAVGTPEVADAVVPAGDGGAGRTQAFTGATGKSYTAA